MPKQTSSEKRPTINYAIMLNQILFRQFRTIIEIMHLAVMKHAMFPLIPRNIDALRYDREMVIKINLLGIYGNELAPTSQMRSKSFFIGKDRFWDRFRAHYVEISSKKVSFAGPP